MLIALDTLISLVVIVTIASLFLTIFVQMLSAALSLHGKSLTNALALTQQVIAAIEISNLRTRIQQRLTEIQAEFFPVDPAKPRQSIQLLLRRRITVRKTMLGDLRLKTLEGARDDRLLPVS